MKKIFYYFIPLLVFFSACQNEKKELVGPEYKSADGNFELITGFSAYTDNVKFATGGKQFFNAQFNEIVTWTITIKGKTSKAEKALTGLSDKVNESNSLWLGTHDDLLFFQSGEEAEAILSVLGHKETYKVNFTIQSARVYPGAKELGNGFESFKEKDPLWGYSPYLDDKKVTFGGLVTSPKLEGKYAFKLSGTDLNHDFFIGSVRKTIPSDFVPPSVKDFYVNVYVYGNGSTTSELKLSLKHDTYTKYPNGKPDGYEDTEDDAFEYSVPLNFKGWKLVSVKYSAFTRTIDKDYGGSGPNIKDPTKLAAIDFTLISKAVGGDAEVVLDYPTITFDKPFMP